MKKFTLAIVAMMLTLILAAPVWAQAADPVKTDTKKSEDGLVTQPGKNLGQTFSLRAKTQVYDTSTVEERLGTAENDVAEAEASVASYLAALTHANSTMGVRDRELRGRIDNMLEMISQAVTAKTTDDPTLDKGRADKAALKKAIEAATGTRAEDYLFGRMLANIQFELDGSGTDHGSLQFQPSGWSEALVMRWAMGSRFAGASTPSYPVVVLYGRPGGEDYRLGLGFNTREASRVQISWVTLPLNKKGVQLFLYSIANLCREQARWLLYGEAYDAKTAPALRASIANK